MSFTSNKINDFNKLFYTKAEKKLINNLPDLFTKLDLFNIALHNHITSKISSKEISVMEMASGSKMDRWKTFMGLDRKRKWNVLLTDFDKSILPDMSTFKNTGNFNFDTEIYSLLEKFPKKKTLERHDVVLSSYTFDNVWLENDFHLTKIDNVWYKNLYEVDIPKIKGKLKKQFFKNLKIKTQRKKIDINSLQHGVFIKQFFKNEPSVHVNYTAGLISSVVNSFENVLKDGGVFITADIATKDNSKEIKGFKSVNETIKIKIENYALAKFILEKLGYTVGLKSVCEFIKDTGIITPVPIHDHFVLTIKK